jgi:hypothetical protein
MSAGLPLIADITQRGPHGRKVPQADIRLCQRTNSISLSLHSFVKKGSSGL